MISIVEMFVFPLASTGVGIFVESAGVTRPESEGLMLMISWEIGRDGRADTGGLSLPQPDDDASGFHSFGSSAFSLPFPESSEGVHPVGLVSAVAGASGSQEVGRTVLFASYTFKPSAVPLAFVGSAQLSRKPVAES